MAIFSLLALSAAALVSSVYGHSVEICVSSVDGTVTFYGATYHSTGELSSYGGTVGGVLITDSSSVTTRYDFTGTVIDDNESPSGFRNLSCSACPTYTSAGIQVWQTVTVGPFTPGTYGVATTCDTAVECPWCSTFDDLVIEVEGTLSPTDEPTLRPSDNPTPRPTNSPTVAPTWVAPCLNMPCDCDSESPGFEDPYCSICHSNGCDQCMGTNGQYWKWDYNYPCVSCEDTFGPECLQCGDFDGCQQCVTGYDRTFDATEGLWHCVVKPPVPSPTDHPTPNPVPAPPSSCNDGIQQCESTNCAAPGDNEYCSSQQSWGCPSCDPGYFMKGHQYPCTICSALTGCNTCADYQGCTSCHSGYTWYWDSLCNIGMCL